MGPEALRERARAAFAEATQVAPAPVTASPLDLQLARHGLIAPALRAELRRRAVHDVIEPCASALLDSPARRSSAAAVGSTSMSASVGQARTAT